MLDFASDVNMTVRECAWMAFRPYVIGDLKSMMRLLGKAALDPDANIRRFAIETSRPRSVWGAHIQELKADPRLGLELVESVRADPSRYVQKSVGNWLNDASKTQPDWVLETCARWSTESKCKETHYIISRALRTIHPVHLTT
jgi:3-methyladenine DNA glycosylase AlkC